MLSGVGKINLFLREAQDKAASRTWINVTEPQAIRYFHDCSTTINQI